MKSRHIAIAITGVLLFIPSLWIGFLLDDYLYLGAIEGRYPDHDTGRSLFTYFINDEAQTRRIADEGGYPWWIDERVRSLTFRPLSDLLLRADHALYDRSPPGYHLHSLLWWAAALAACALLYRRLLPGTVGAIALLIFALDEVHVMAVAWVANRNALVAFALVMIGFWAWIRWREDRWRAGRVLGPLCWVLGLTGSELSLAALAYVVAYELFGRRSIAVRARLGGLAPVIALVAIYIVVYRSLGYGGWGSGLYYHPLSDPIAFVVAAASRIPTLLASGIACLSADLWFFAPRFRSLQVVVGCCAVAGLILLLRAGRSHLEDRDRSSLRWLLIGSGLSLIPIVAAFPSDRMLLVPGFGLTAALAAVITAAFRSRRTSRRRLLIGAGGLLALGHLVLAPLLAVLIQTILIRQNHESLALAASPVVCESAGRETVLIYAPDHVVGIYMPLLMEQEGCGAPQGWRPLSIAPCNHVLKRTGPRTLELAAVDGGVMLRSVFEVLYRNPKNDLRPGEIVDRGLFRAEILDATSDGLTRVAFHFDRELTDPGVRFLVWLEGDLKQLEIPDVGGELYIERTLGPGGF